MSNDQYEYAGLLLSVATTAVCLAVAAWATARAAFRAKDRGDALREAHAAEPPGAARRVFDRLRIWVPVELGTFAVILLAVSLAYLGRVAYRTPVPRGEPLPQWVEVEQSAEWRAWRADVHERLAPEPVTKEALVAALRLKRPGVPATATEADRLRRDEAVADVFMSYKGARDLLWKRFGIDENFLGTGMSKPLGQVPYSAAAVHEYLVDNLPDTHEHVFYWKMAPLGRNISMPIRAFVGGEEGERVPPENPKKGRHTFEDELKEIQLRVKNKDHPFPPLIRFARFDEKFYKNTLGRPDAYRVFTSNLSEVWDLTIQQAAEKSGYRYDKGDTMFVWIYVPYHSNEFTHATWSQVLHAAPDWLEAGN